MWKTSQPDAAEVVQSDKTRHTVVNEKLFVQSESWDLHWSFPQSNHCLPQSLQVNYSLKNGPLKTPQAPSSFKVVQSDLNKMIKPAWQLKCSPSCCVVESKIKSTVTIKDCCDDPLTHPHLCVCVWEVSGCSDQDTSAANRSEERWPGSLLPHRCPYGFIVSTSRRIISVSPPWLFTSTSWRREASSYNAFFDVH